MTEYAALLGTVVLIAWVGYAITFRLRRRWRRDAWYRRRAAEWHGEWPREPWREDR